ncbi:hypothetical protein BDV25DRAFT_170291 [Aspergillus avenaceus]|uniref:Uncharacterized protein n=1 Tax=Aspergillus avenaceus TaxID=36643 RepID=A0A5N6THX6_ASPAV|nr:hypothetical protein BDV25DRAFT_170291 [Aspergillus avenaceus]
MEPHQEPSLLDYARYHGIATDYTTVDPLTKIEEFLPELDLPALPQDKLSDFQEYIYEFQRCVEDDLRKEKFNLRKEDARLLSSVIRQARAEKTDINWNEVLPAFNKDDELKLEVPILGIDSVLNPVPAKVPLRYDLDTFHFDALDEPPLGPEHDAIIDEILREGEDMMRDIKAEKLRCSKESLLLIQRARKPAGFPFEEFEGLLENMRLSSQGDNPFPESPPYFITDADDSWYRSPSPVPASNMLPSSFPSDGHGPELVHNWGSTPGIDSNIDECNLASKHSTKSYSVEEGLACTNDMDLPDTYVPPDHASKTMQPNLSTSYSTPDVGPVHSLPLANGTPSNEAIIDERNNISRQQDTLQIPSSDIPLISSHRMSRSPIQTFETNTASKELSSQQKDHNSSASSERGNRGMDPTSSFGIGAPGCWLDESTSNINPITSERKTTTSSDTVIDSTECINLCYTPLARRKRRHEEKTVVIPDESKQANFSRAPMLGSLSAFMETRGRVQEHSATVSPYFIQDQPKTSNINLQCSIPCSQSHTPPPTHPDTTIIEQQDCHPAPGRQQYPQFQTHTHEQPLLFLSTSLLKTHLSIVRALERMPTPPGMIYRDYEDDIHARPSQPPTNTSLTLPKEADIIISPTTGIILTTLQATTQLFLPGHRLNPKLNGLKCINSPLRERIFLLSSRYKRLYIFVTHSTSETKGTNSWTADSRSLNSFTALTAFCDSLSSYSTISPILLPQLPETIIGWILALAQKHTFQFPCSSNVTGFTPINPPSAMEKETSWELFLRRVGLNPYAAQTVLTSLKVEGKNPVLEGDIEEGFGALSVFIEMPSDRRQELFGAFMGEYTQKVIERDWQCDWALDLSDTVQL